MLEILSKTNPEISTFPVLRGLMAKHKNLNNTQMGKIIGDCYRTFGKKLSGDVNFSFSDMWTIRDYFNSKGENLTIDDIFFAWLVHNSEQ
jgi:hypothetical protein